MADVLKGSSQINCDAVEWAPTVSAGGKRLLAVATYEWAGVRTEPRHGHVKLIGVRGADGSEPLGMQQVSQIDTRGVLDIKWQGRMLADANSDGSVGLHVLDEDETACATVARVRGVEEEEEHTIALSLDWDSHKDGRLAVSLSTGKLAVMHAAEAGLTRERTFDAHDLYGQVIEVWITAFDRYAPEVLYSGADDTFFKAWDLRTDCARPTLVNKSHGMGVCSIQSNPHREFELATGSYDESFRLFDTRNLRKPLLEYPLGGGVWRIKWNPARESRVLIATMRAGIQVLDLSPDAQAPVYHYHGHDPELSYGVDWAPGPDQSLVGTCSFTHEDSYHVWRVPQQ